MISYCNGLVLITQGKFAAQPTCDIADVITYRQPVPHHSFQDFIAPALFNGPGVQHPEHHACRRRFRRFGSKHPRDLRRPCGMRSACVDSNSVRRGIGTPYHIQWSAAGSTPHRWTRTSHNGYIKHTRREHPAFYTTTYIMPPSSPAPHCHHPPTLPPIKPNSSIHEQQCDLAALWRC